MSRVSRPKGSPLLMVLGTLWCKLRRRHRMVPSVLEFLSTCATCGHIVYGDGIDGGA